MTSYLSRDSHQHSSPSRAEEKNFSATVPGIVTIAISPSQVLQIQNFRETDRL